MAIIKIGNESGINNWEKFKILVWKNWCIQWNNRREFVFSILSPVIFCSILVFLRFLVGSQVVPTIKYNVVNMEKYWNELIKAMSERYEIVKDYSNLTYNVYIPRLTIVFAPNKIKIFRNIMRQAVIALGNLNFKGFSSCEELKKAMQTDFYLAGVCFDNDYLNVVSESIYLVNNYTNRLNYSLIFPSELRFYNDNYVSFGWCTDKLYDITYNDIHHVGKSSDGGPVGYIREGFASIQNAIAMSYIRLMTGVNDLPNIYLRRFPYGKHVVDVLAGNTDKILPMIMLTGYIYPIMVLAKHIVRERETGSTMTLKLMGIPSRMHLAAWFVNGVALLSLDSLLILILFKVHWLQGYAVLNKSSWIAVFIVMTIYNIYTICFCLMVCTFVTESTSMGIVPLIWFIIFIPYIPTTTSLREPTNRICEMLLYIFFPNSVMGVMFDDVISYEQRGRGFHFSSFFDTNVLTNDFTVGVYLSVLIFISVIFLIIGLYMEEAKLISNDDIAMRWYTNIAKCFQNRSGPKTRLSENLSSVHLRRTKVYEVDKLNKLTTVNMENLTKVYNGNIVLNDISLKLFEDDITILMGHNGAGKTVLLKILAGLIQPSEGEVYINDVNVKLFPTKRESMGVCLSAEYLYKDLTVIEQLMLVGRFRGLSEVEIEEELEKYITEMDMVNVRDVMIVKLPDSTKQKLAVACALAGQTKIVLLDNPTSQLDLNGRLLMWKLLTQEKKGRTIVVTTHNSLESEVIGDRLVFLSGGELKCCGTPFFVRKIYGDGYRLNCYKGPNCNPAKITEIVQKYAIIKEINVGAQFSYSIQQKHLEFLEQLLDELDANADELNIASYSIIENSMENLYLKLGSENPAEDNKKRFTDILNGQSIYSEEYQELPFLRKYKPLGKYQLWINHWWAMFYKRYVYRVRNKGNVLVQIIMPLLFTCVALSVAYWRFDATELIPMFYSLSQYKAPITLIDATKNKNRRIEKYVDEYRQIVFWHGYKYEDIEDSSISTYILDKLHYHSERMNHQYHIGVSFGKYSIVAWFNNYALHTVPLSLNMVHNAIVKSLQSSDAEINLGFEPLPYVNKNHVTLMHSSISFGSLLAVNLIFCISFTWTLNVIFLVRERQNNFKLLQFVSGVPVLIFLMSTILVDLILIVFFAFSTSITIILFRHATFLNNYVIATYFAVLVIGGICVLVVNHFLSTFSNNFLNAYNTITALNSFGCACFYAILRIRTEGFYVPIETKSVFDWIIRLLPQFSFANALVKIFDVGQLNRICEYEDIKLLTIEVEKCSVIPNCCTEYQIFSHGDGILAELYFLVVITIICCIFIVIREHQNTWRHNYTISVEQEHSRFLRRDTVLPPQIQNEVAAELDKILSIKLRDYRDKPLICNGVHKKVGNTVIFEPLFFVIERGECFGLLGTNESILLRMLIGEQTISSGNVYVDGYDMRTELNDMQKCISYAPKYTELPPEFKISEILKITCLLRGLPRDQTSRICESLAKVLGIFGHYNKQLKECSDGNKKRLNWACAFLGNPSMIYMDQPTRDIDGAGRLQLWNIIGRLCRNGATVMFTSLATKECEEICTRLAFISNGRIKSIGRPWDLSKKYTQGYVLTARLKSMVSYRHSHTLKAFLNFSTFMENEFPTARMKDHSGNVIVFFIPSTTTTISRIFRKLRTDAFILNVESFSLSRDTSSLHYAE